MSETTDQQAVIQLLTTITRDTGQIKTDLAVNTNDTKGIKDHLANLNGKVVKQEGRIQTLEEQERETKRFIEDTQNMMRRKSDRRSELLQKIFLVAVTPLAIAIWQIVQYLISQGVFKN
jgi:chromosome segregation ATPase